MSGVKRVLWVDDNLTNKAASLFDKSETRTVSSMDGAIAEITGDRLYDYDTIVLDIDFENGLVDADEVIEKLCKTIYLTKDQRQDRNFIISNGGYLLFLYLLEKGYPSERVAFLTGNAGIIGQLKEYTSQNAEPLSKEEIAERFLIIWEETGCEKYEEFEARIRKLPIHQIYKNLDFVSRCAELMDDGKTDALRALIQTVKVPVVVQEIQNTGDKMIFRFHEANLESPIYFSKNDNDIAGHNLKDAKKWLSDKRTDDAMTRWLIMSAANYIEKEFDADTNGMNAQMQVLFDRLVSDGGIRAAFNQMYYVFDGLRVRHRSIYFQSLSAMLIPFEGDPKIIRKSPKSADDDEMRAVFARFAKQARNYCAHNYFGTEISNKTTLLLMMATMTAVLSKDQRDEMSAWYQKAAEILLKGGMHVTYANNKRKIETLTGDLLSNNKIDIVKAKVGSTTTNYRYREYLRALGYNLEMQPDAQDSTGKREAYYVFTLAAYVSYWFNGMKAGDVKQQFGEEVSLLRDVCENIVDKYGYPVK